MTKQDTIHGKALQTLRQEHFGRKLSYRESAEILTALSGEAMQKSYVWYLEHKSRKCPTPVRLALESIELLYPKPKRYRLHYEVDAETYETIQSYLGEQDETFTRWMDKQEVPWE